eukprot:756600-Hanusia_phi.AAC.2
MHMHFLATHLSASKSNFQLEPPLSPPQMLKTRHRAYEQARTRTRTHFAALPWRLLATSPAVSLDHDGLSSGCSPARKQGPPSFSPETCDRRLLQSQAPPAEPEQT